jgi:hypothetical protein
MLNYNLEKKLKDSWFNTNDTFSLIEKWVDEKKLADYKNLYTCKDFYKQLQFAGFDKEEVSISYENDYLTVDANSSMLNSQYSKKYYLPSTDYNIDNISVKFEKCILTIDCKLKEEKESKLIKIKIK